MLVNAVGGKIARELGDELRHGSRAHVPNPLQRGDEVVRVDPCRVAVDALARIGSQQDLREDPVQEHPRRVDLDAARAREDERRLDEIGPLPGAEPPMRLLEAGDEAGHRDGALSDPERLRVPALEVHDHLFDVAQRLRRRGEEAVEDDGFALRLAHEEKTPARRTRERSLADRSDESGSDAGIHGVPALAQHSRARLCRERMAGRDRAVRRALTPASSRTLTQSLGEGIRYAFGVRAAPRVSPSEGSSVARCCRRRTRGPRRPRS